MDQDRQYCRPSPAEQQKWDKHWMGVWRGGENKTEKAAARANLTEKTNLI